MRIIVTCPNLPLASPHISPLCPSIISVSMVVLALAVVVVLVTP